MFKTILYLWVILTICLFAIAVWFLMNMLKKRLAKTKQPVNNNSISNKYNLYQDSPIDQQDGKIDEEELEEKLNDQDDEQSAPNNFSRSTILEEIIVQNIGDVDGDGQDDYLLEERIITTESQINSDVQDIENHNEVEEPQLSVSQEEVPEMPQENDSFQESTIPRHHSYQKIDDSQQVETPKNISSPLNIWLWHSRDDIVRDKFEKHIQKIRYDAGILRQRNDILGYEKKLVEGLTVLPNDIDLEKQLADLYFHQGKYKKAQSLLKKIIAENPEDHNALRQMWEIATEDKQGNDDAFAYLQQAYTLCDDNPKYAYSLAQRYYDHDDFQSALPLLEKITKLRPKNIDYLVSLSHLQHKIWDLDGAKNSILRALELDPMNMTLKHYLKSLQ